MPGIRPIEAQLHCNCFIDHHINFPMLPSLYFAGWWKREESSLAHNETPSPDQIRTRTNRRRNVLNSPRGREMFQCLTVMMTNLLCVIVPLIHCILHTALCLYLGMVCLTILLTPRDLTYTVWIVQKDCTSPRLKLSEKGKAENYRQLTFNS